MTPGARVTVAALALVAVWPLAMLAGGVRGAAEVAGAVALAVAVSTAVPRRWPPAVTGAVAVIALVTYEIGVVCRGTGVGTALAEAGAALRSGAAPSGPNPVPAAVALAVAWSCSELAARVATPAVRVLPAVAGLGLSLAIAAPALGGGQPVIAGAVSTALVLALVTARPGWRARRWVGAGPVALAAGALAAMAAPAWPGTVAARYDPWIDRAPPVEPLQGPSPLSDVGRLLGADDDPVMFTADLPAGERPARLPVAVLDAYDGEVWTVDPVHEFRRRPAPVAADDGAAVHQRYELTAAYTGLFVPHLDRVVDTPGARDVLGVAPSAGVVRPAGAPAPFRYDLVSVREDDPAPAAATAERLRRVPPLPAELVALVRQLPGNNTGERLAAAVAHLRGPRVGYDRRAPAGHAYPRLAALVRADPGAPARARSGTSEQNAALLAVLARALGAPAVVVVGYEVGAAPQVRASQIHAWVRAHLPGRGWVELDPTDRRPRPPGAGPAAAPVTAAPGRAVAGPAAPVPRAGPPSTAGPGSRCPAAPCAPGAGPVIDDRGLPAVPVLVAAVLAVPVTPGAVRRVRRHRRRRRRGTVARVLGAWQETADRLHAHGVPVAVASTPARLAATPGLGAPLAESLRAWAPVLDATLFAPAEPGEHLAADAWRADAAVARALRSSSPRRVRLRAALAPRTARIRVPRAATALGNVRL